MRAPGIAQGSLQLRREAANGQVIGRKCDGPFDPLRRALRFTWDVTANEVLRVYDEVVRAA